MLAALQGVTMRTALIAGISVIFAAGLCELEVKPFAGQQADNSRSIDSILSPGLRPDEPGLAALVKDRGRILFEKGYGVREISSHAGIDPQTNFRLASCSKQFTAMSIMLLVHDGKLRYDDKLTDIFPEFPAYGRTISVRNLLNHVSGLPDYEDLMEAVHPGHWTAENQIADGEVLSLLETQKATKFPP